ncbi:hypothetical protein ACH4D3_13790 [Streptomyces sp. NPDC018026]|uniref:hypothetical protein n=1 Tax=Streptomyces sp. NPDC018026 TaxID=3365031 RepID=UPI0037AC615E
MTVHIEGVPLAIFVIACVVGYAIYRRSQTQSAVPGTAAPGNAGEAIMVAAAVVTALMLLFTGAGAEADSRQSTPTEQPSPTDSSRQPSATSLETPAP